MLHNYSRIGLVAAGAMILCGSAIAGNHIRQNTNGEVESRCVSATELREALVRKANRQNRAHKPLFYEPVKEGRGIQPMGGGRMRVSHASSVAKVKNAPSRILADAPRGNLYGTVVSYKDMMTYDQAYWGKIDPKTGVVSRIFSGADLINGQDYDIQSGAVRDGILYTPVVREDMMAGMSIQWNRRDLATGDEMTPVVFGANDATYAYTMCYDPDDDIFHILSLDAGTGSFGLYATVDPRTWDVTTYSKPSGADFLAAIAYNPADGQVYALSDTNELFVLDEASCSLVTVGYIDDDYPLGAYQTTTAMTYSPLDGAFAVMYVDNNEEQMKIVFVDPETGEVTDGITLSPSYPFFSCLYSPDAYATNDAPELPAMPETAFEGPATKGTITFSAPEYSFAGTKFGEGNKLATVLKVDGEILFEGDLRPGESRTVDFSGEEGLHNATLQCLSGAEASPERAFRFYLGHDTPMAPTNVSFNVNKLTWNPVGAVGVNGGYVEADAVTYDVYVNEEIQNESPITGTEFIINTDRELGLANISVVACANGKESANASVNEVIGRPLQLPWSMNPTQEESGLFTIMDADNDGNTYQYIQMDDSGKWAFVMWLGYGDVADDWLFLPLTDFASGDVLYNLSFNYSASSPYEDFENLEVCLGRSMDPEKMEKTIYSHQNYVQSGDAVKSVNFAIPEPGEWYVGFHCTTVGLDGAGVCLNDFRLTALNDRSSAAPTDAQSVRITAAPKGELQATLDIVAPTVDMMGKPLPADGILTFDITCDKYNATAQALPGATCSVTMAVPKSGFAKFDIVPSNAAGAGLSKTYTSYVGFDSPMAPKNIRYIPSDDNLSLTMTWDTPGEVGQNGGYVDPTELYYPIYTVVGVTFNEIGRTKENTYTFKPYNDNIARYTVGPTALNEYGESKSSIFTSEILGTPWPIPATENFGDIFDMDPYYFLSDGTNAGSQWVQSESIRPYGTNAAVDCNKGCLMVYSTVGHNITGEVVLTKVSTKDSHSAVFKLRWLDWAYTPKFSIWARRAGHVDLEKLADLDASRPVRGEWRDDEILLPEGYNDCGWVEFHVRAELTSEDREYGFIDGFSVSQNVEYDLKVASVSAPEKLSVGETAQALVTVVNAGSELISGNLKVTVADSADKVFTTSEKNISRLTPGQTFLEYVDIEALREFLEGGKLVITATVEADDDEIGNNNTVVREVIVDSGIAPSVGDLTAAWDDEHKSATLNWSEPTLTYGGYDGFEFLEPFAITEELGMWRNIDRDGHTPFLLNGLEWPGMKEVSAWQPFDAAALNLMTDPRLAPHSGNMYLMARACSVDTEKEDPVKASDWLISPEVVGGTQVSFWYGTIDTQYTEYVELWISETGNNPEDFHYQRTFSKSGEEGWEEVRFTLPEGAKHFALVYASYDSFGAMLDDITFTPARLEKWVVDHYTVVRTADGDVKEIADVTVPGYVDLDADAAGKELVYHVLTAVKTADGFRFGPRSNAATLQGTWIDDIHDLRGVSGTKGAIIAEGLGGNVLAIYGTDGRHLRSVDVTSDNARIACEAGVYIVKCGNAIGKVLVR